MLTRDESRAAVLAGPQVTVVVGDVRSPGTLISAMEGVGTVISAMHGMAGPGKVTPMSVDRDGNFHLVDAAKVIGAPFVMVSVVGAAVDHQLELFRMKAQAEEYLKRSGLEWTVVRSAAFKELFLDLLRDSAGTRGRPLVFGRGTNPINFVPVADVATAVVFAALTPSQAGSTVEVIGARDFTLNGLSATVQEELGTGDLAPRHIHRWALRAIAGSRVLVNSEMSRLAAAALFMDTAPGSPSIAV